MFQTYQSVKVTKKGANQGRAGKVVGVDGESVLVQLDGDTEPVAFKLADLEAL